MTNTKMLRKKIDDSGYKLRFVAKRAGVTYQGFLNKVNNETEFKATEIQSLCNLLSISGQEKEDIFFANKVE